MLEVAELGISGSKSQNKASDSPVMKEDKELSPASRRVRDAAEHLLSVVLEQVGQVETSVFSYSILQKYDIFRASCGVQGGGPPQTKLFEILQRL